MMLSYLEILRIPNAILSIVAVIVSAILVGFYSPLQIAIACAAVFLISGAGMVINDYFDYEADKVNRPKRPLPSGRISKRNALVYSLILFAIGNLLTLFLNIQMTAIALVNTLLLVAYSWKLKKVLLVGNFVVSYETASILVFGSLLSGSITATIIILSTMVFSMNTAREIAKTIEDMEGDRKINARTLPIVAGKNFAAWTAIFFVIFAVLFSPLPYMFHLLNVYYIYLVTITDIVLLYSCFVLLLSPKKSQKMMKIAMFAGLVSFLVGTL
ncbi:MAG: UbiA family prenyltransferase [Candidatus Aenigmatarchaeota archaeon]